MKKKIIFIQFVKFLDFHYHLFEIDYLKKCFDIEVHDLSYFFNKKSHENYRYLDHKKKIIKFQNLANWYQKITNEYKQYKNNLYLFYEGNPLSFKFLYYHYLLSRQKINIVYLKQNTLPSFDIKKNYPLKDNLIYKLHRLFKRNKHVFFEKKFEIINFFLNIISKNFPPKIIFANGIINKKSIKKKFSKSKVVSLNSWDASKIFFKEKKINYLKKGYGVYLTPFTLNSASDSNAYGYKKLEIAKNVFNCVNKGLNAIEKKYKKKILIGLHPRSEDTIKKFKELGNRPSYKYKSMELIKNSKFVITHMSIAISYAVLFYKPLIFIFTKEHKKNLFYMRYNKLLANFFFSKTINIEKINELELKNHITKKMKIRYEYFKKKYLLSDKFKNTPNYKIIENIIYSSK